MKRTASLGSESGAYALDYSAEKGQFVSAVNQTGMCFYTDKMSFIRYVQPAQKTTLTLQGICTDGKYVYHILYSPSSNQEEPENMIFVYDWNGKYIAKIPIGIKAYEPENISLVGDTFYIGCNNPTWTGGVVFTARLVRE